MSENTIGILVTRRRDGQPGEEFRVAHVRASDFFLISEDPNYPFRENPILNRERVLQLFGSSEVFTDRDQMIGEVGRLWQELGRRINYDICDSYADLYFPASDGKRRRRGRRRRFH